MNNGLATPILLIIFNRPDTTEKVFNEIKKIKPKKLFVSADGPRENKPGEKEKCLATRKIIDQVDWECEVYKKYSDVNLGCKLGVSSGIDWFFKNVEQGIILEDDCLPAQSFFKFCEELLEKYKNNDKIMMISGDNFQNGRQRGDGSYYFSKFSHIWGWATWRRAWEHYSVNMEGYPKFKQDKKINAIWNKKYIRKYWTNIFDQVYENKIDTWDYQWAFSIWKMDGLCVIPNYNLISNIGFRDDATHTKSANKLANQKIQSMDIIKHPFKIEQNKKADNYYSKIFKKSLFKKILNKINALYNL